MLDEFVAQSSEICLNFNMRWSITNEVQTKNWFHAHFGKSSSGRTIHTHTHTIKSKQTKLKMVSTWRFLRPDLFQKINTLFATREIRYTWKSTLNALSYTFSFRFQWAHLVRHIFAWSLNMRLGNYSKSVNKHTRAVHHRALSKRLFLSTGKKLLWSSVSISHDEGYWVTIECACGR